MTKTKDDRTNMEIERDALVEKMSCMVEKTSIEYTRLNTTLNELNEAIKRHYETEKVKKETKKLRWPAWATPAITTGISVGGALAYLLTTQIINLTEPLGEGMINRGLRFLNSKF